MGVWLFYAILSAFIDALNFTFCKTSINCKIDPILALFVRTVVMLIVLIIVILVLRKFTDFSIKEMVVNYKPWVSLYAAGALSAFSYIFYFVAMKYGAESRVYAVDQLTYVFIMMLAFFILKETITWKMLIGSAFILTGCLLCV